MESVAIDTGLKYVFLMIGCLVFFTLLFQFTACDFRVKNKPEIVAMEGFQWPAVTDKCITKCCS